MSRCQFFLFFFALCGFSLSVCQADEIHLKINAGGNDVGDWKSDAPFADGGNHFTFSGKHDVTGIKNAAPNAVYETVRHRDHGYSFPQLPDGDYLVRFHFTDQYADGNRKMVYLIEGKKVIEGFSPWSEAGKKTMKVVARDVEISVSDGNGLQIRGEQGGGSDVFEAALEIIGIDVKGKIDPKRDPSKKPKSSTADAVKALTGQPTRLVWAQILKNPASDHNATVLRNSVLVGFDTEDGRGERVILDKPAAYGKPMLTPDGTRVVYSSRNENRWFVVDFEGGKPRLGADGFASDIWRDAKTGIDWVYARTPAQATSGKIERFQLDNPKVRELVFDEAPVGHLEVPWFRVSADGKVAAEAFPWPKCGVAYLDGSNTWEAKGNGCWTSLAADNSYRMMHFLGVHTELALYEPGIKKGRKIKLNNVPGLAGQKLYHPRWGRNHTGYITVTGPQWSPSTEIYLGKFDSDVTKVERWVKVSSNHLADSHGDVWIQPSKGDAVRATVARFAPKVPAGPAWPVASDRLLWGWENGLANNQVVVDGQLKSCEVKFRSGSVLTPQRGMDLADGWAEADDEPEKRIVAACRATNQFTIEATFSANETDPSGAIVLGMINPKGKARNLALLQKQDELICEIRHSKDNATQISVGEVKKGKPQHIVLRMEGGTFEAWLDGRQVASQSGLGDFGNWLSSPALVFGGEKRGDRWSGSLEGVAIYGEALSDNQIVEGYNLATSRGASTSDGEKIVVKARVKELSEIPNPADLDYPRSLGRDLWEILTVESGELKAREVSVTRWVILDRKLVPGASDLKVGDTATLSLQPYEDRPELSGEHQTNNLSVFDAPVFHHVP